MRVEPGVPLGFRELLRQSESVTFETGAARLPLRHRFLQFGSEVVHEGDSIRVRNRDYGIDYGRGVLLLLAPAVEARTLVIDYLYLPAPRQRTYRAAEIHSRDEALGASQTAVDAPAPLRDPRAARDLSLPPTLQLSGSKTIGVSFGRNREASIDQSLRVEVSGELGDDLQVNAVLSDDNLPVRPEGNTEELGDLSKVFIEMQGPVVGGVLGDFQIERRESEFTALQRDLRGGEARVRFGKTRVAAGAGLAKGELRTATFRGVEGKQGPYELLSARRIEFSTVLPGSERVHMDGELLRRGDNHDYVIDYDRGELRFTSRRRVTADSEIGVDFQVTNERYRRGTRLARVQGETDRVRWGGFFFEEGDDRDKPVGAAYDPDEIAALEQAGDRPAIAPGIRAVGAGLGIYRYDAVDSTIVVFDAVNGDLEVDFYEVGGGRGRYDDDLDALSGRRFFVFVGPGRGDFEIGRLLPPPGRARLASANIEATPWRGTRLVGEASLSGSDRNLFSSRDDGDNLGEAIDLRFESSRRSRGRAGSAGFDVHLSRMSERFRSPGRGRPAFYYKEWNAEQDSLSSLEHLVEGTLHYARGGDKPWLQLATNAGRLDRGDALVTDRLQWDLGLGNAQRGLDLRLQLLDTERPELGADAGRTRRFARTGGRYRFGFLQPELRFETDSFVRAERDSLARPSFRYFDSAVRLGLVETRRTTASFDLGRRDTDARRTAAERATGLEAWRPERRNDTYGISVLGQPTQALRTEVGLSRRTNEPRGPGGGAATRSDLARIVLGWSPRQRAARSEWRYTITDEEARVLQQVLVLAPDGRGDYDAEGRPVGRDQGLYDKVFRFSGDVERVQRVESSLRLEFGGLGGFAASRDTTTGWLRRNVSLVQFLSVQEQTRSDRRRDLYLLVPSAFQTDATLFGTFQVRQEWSFRNASPRDALRLFLEYESELDGRFAGNRVDGRRSSATLRYDRTGTQRWTWGGETGAGRRERTGALDGAVPGRPTSGFFDVRSARVLGRLSYRLSASERLGVDTEYTRQNDTVSQAKQQLVSLGPTATLAPVRHLRLLANVTVARVFEDKPEAVLAPFLFDAPGTRTSASLTGSYRLGQNLNLNLTYNGLRNTDGRTTYDVKAETRAIF